MFQPAQETRPTAPTSSRRTLLNVLLGTGLVGWVASALYPMLRYLSPLPEAASADEAELDDKAKSAIGAVGFAIVPFGSERVLVLRDRQGELRAVSAKCTHEGCTVQYKADESLIWCACHNGRFDLDGRVLSGPPPRPLARFHAAGALDGRVAITREQADA